MTDPSNRKLQDERRENWLSKYLLVIVGISCVMILAIAQIVGSLIQAGWFLGPPPR